LLAKLANTSDFDAGFADAFFATGLSLVLGDDKWFRYQQSPEDKEVQAGKSTAQGQKKAEFTEEFAVPQLMPPRCSSLARLASR
jgi:hypothetical protein